MEIEDSLSMQLRPNEEGMAVMNGKEISEDLMHFLSALSGSALSHEEENVWYIQLLNSKVLAFLISEPIENSRVLRILDFGVFGHSSGKELLEFVLAQNQTTPSDVQSDVLLVNDLLRQLRAKIQAAENKDVRVYRHAGERRRSESSQRKHAPRRSLEPGRIHINENIKKKVPARPKIAIGDDVLPWPNARTLPAAFLKRKKQDNA